MQDGLKEFTESLIQDLKDLREGKITNADARVRAQVAREVLRATHLQLEGMRFIEQQAKPVQAKVTGKKGGK